MSTRLSLAAKGLSRCAYCDQDGCKRRICRAVRAFWYGPLTVSAGRSKPPFERGPDFHVLCLAEFLIRMAMPKTGRELEFSKRYRSRRVLRAGMSRMRAISPLLVGGL